MALTPGTRIGPYEVIAPLGKGAMGEVYRAKDTQLERDVAVKVLPTELASDAERLARFDREARSLAALNHVNVAAIYGVENAAGTTALVMELVEGPTLAERIAAGPIPLDEALPIAAQIAAGVEAAHGRGILHRDLKPANVKVRPDGVVKVLDFGLAKPLDPAADGRRGSAATTSVATTRAGFTLGTAAYMSPEQARGRAVDKRTDVWAFGCVLYEMLTGQLAFDADGTTDTLAAVIRGEPDWSRLPDGTPAIVRRLLRRCLAKDPQQRLPELGTARLDIAEAQTPVEETTDARAGLSTPWRWAAASLGALAVLALAATMAFRSEPAAPQLRVDLAVFAGAFSLSPDGRELAYVARTNGERMISIRSLEDGTTRLLAGTEGARSIFWAPDGRSIGFLGGKPTSRVDLSDGAIHVLNERTTDGSPSGAWNADDDILYPVSGVSPLLRLNPAQPGLSEATTLGDGEVSHLAPYFLADGRRFIYFVRGEKTGIYLGSLDGGIPRQLVTSDGGGVIAAGHLVFPRQGALIAQPFDLERMEPSGEAFRIAEPEDQSVANVVYSVSSSADGTLAFRPSVPAQNELVWFSRAGTELGRVPDSAGANTPELSSDGRRLIASRGGGLWTFDLMREIWAPLQTTGAFGAWSKDGRSIAYETIARGYADFHIKPAELAASAERVLSTPTLKKLLQWSPDGRFLLYTGQRDDGLDNDILVLPLEGDRTPIPLVSTRFQEFDARFSPDGRWIAYQSNETGRYEIWAQPFPGPGERVRISTTGGAQAQWSGDGQEIFYVALDERLMAVPLMRSADGARIEPGDAVPLFTTRIQNGAIQPGGWRQQYVAAPDGQSFLINTLVDADEPRPITLLFNWKPERLTGGAR